MKLLIFFAHTTVIAVTAHAQWDFDFSYNSPTDSNAGNYVIENDRIFVWNASGDAPFYGVLTGQAEGHMTQKFSFTQDVVSAHLLAHITVANFSVYHGSGSIWGSTDGSTWSLVFDAPTPTLGSIAGYSFDEDLPASLLGARDIYLQTRLNVIPGAGAFAQFSPASTPFDTPVFQFRAAVPEPTSAALLLCGAALCMRRQRINY